MGRREEVEQFDYSRLFQGGPENAQLHAEPELLRLLEILGHVNGFQMSLQGVETLPFFENYQRVFIGWSLRGQTEGASISGAYSMQPSSARTFGTRFRNNASSSSRRPAATSIVAITQIMLITPYAARIQKILFGGKCVCCNQTNGPVFRGNSLHNNTPPKNRNVNGMAINTIL